MTKAHFILSPMVGSHNKIEIDGHELSDITKSIRFTMTAGGLPEIELEVFARECSVDADGVVRLDTTGIPDDVAREIFETLKARFEL